MALDWVVHCLRRASGNNGPPPVYNPEPPTQEAYQTAMATVDAMRKERDRWVDEAARSSREVRDLRAARDRAWADLEVAQMRNASLQFQLDRLVEAQADILSCEASPIPPLSCSWSGLKEGE